MSQAVWRTPAVETEDYPNLTVHDGRVSGSINVGHSRLPLWALISMGSAVTQGWGEVEKCYPQVTADYGFSAADFSAFLYFLMEQRGEFGRLVCILADVERQEYERGQKRGDGRAWWEHRASKKRVVDQLRVCLAALDEA